MRAELADSSETLNIVLSLSAPALLREALRIADRKEQVIGFADCLAVGPINPPAPAARVRWMVSELDFLQKDWNWLPRRVDAFWKRALESGLRRVVWTSSRSANEHSAFLAWVERNGDAPYEAVDLADVEVERRTKDGRSRRRPALCLGMLAPETIAAERLWERARSLARSERDAHLWLWRALQGESAPLRIVGPKGLASAPLSAFDESLMSRATHEWRPAVRLIGGTLAEGDGLYFQVGDHVLASRVGALIQAGRLERRLPPTGSPDQPGGMFGLTRLPRDAEVRLPPR